MPARIFLLAVFRLAVLPLQLFVSTFSFILISASAAWAASPDGNIVFADGVVGNFIVILTGHQEYDKGISGLAEKLALKETEPSRVIPTELLPAPLQSKSLELLTPRGRSTLKIKEATLSSGCSFWQLTLQTDKEADFKFPEGIAKLGSPFPRNAKLRKIEGVPGADPSVSKIAPGFKAWVDSKVGAEQRELYQKLNVTIDDFRFEKGAFSQKGKWLAWAELGYTEGRSAEHAEVTFQVAAILDAAGKPIEILAKPFPGMGDSIGSWSPIFGIDTDSDGVEELVYRTSYYEGGSVLVHHELKGKVTDTIIMSDGC